MHEVIIAILFALKGENKAVSGAFIPLFRAVVGAPLKLFDGGDLLGQFGEGGLNFLDLFRRCGLFELEGNDVAELGFFGLLRIGSLR
jgi:hypothetical protein